ncbi:hypothetical protein GMDG_00798 [Pseudogymnoascus destructans 20631-21]|uniref:Uncharacterized protein n=1 Tax=Pseudogymnoascus destructans (strain ATCC MYA-4855 / 20631-21) TaxID=658429 RepID=L8GAZ1_PSED2|nr:hypothetical protein GMDG_00798 [Pseudogymnoascus destructans 20631-21]
MSQGFTAVNVPHEDEAHMGSLAIASYKEDMEDMEDNAGDSDATEASSLIVLSSRSESNFTNITSFHTVEQASSMTPAPAPNTTKKRSPKNAQTNADGTPAPKTPRKNAKQKELNEDSTLVVKATSARKKPAPKLDEDRNVIPKPHRKKAEPKPKTGPNIEPLPKTPRKFTKKVKSGDKVVDDDAADVDMAGDMVSNMVGDMASAKMRGFGDEDSSALKSYYAPTPNGGSSPVIVAEAPMTPKVKKAALAATGTPGGKKKRAAEEDGEMDPFTTPTKKIKATASTPKSGNGKGTAIATSKDQLTDEDKMMIQWRKDGKGWPEIRKKWGEMTGKPPGNSTLPNRYKRLLTNIIDWKDGDVSYSLLLYPFQFIFFAMRSMVSDSTEQPLTDSPHQLERMLVAEQKVTKAFATELYGRMATVMVQLGGDTYTAAAVEKAFLKEKREGFPHAATIDEVMKGPAAPAGDDDDEDIDQAVNGAAISVTEDEGMKAIDQVIGGGAVVKRDDEPMEDAETPDVENSDGGVPISPGHRLKPEGTKGEDDGKMDSDMV